MIAAKISLDGTGLFGDVQERGMKIIHLANNAPPIRVARLVGGMSSGKSSLMIGVEISQKEFLMLEISMELFLSMAAAFQAAENRDGKRGAVYITPADDGNGFVAAMGFGIDEKTMIPEMIIRRAPTVSQALQKIAETLEQRMGEAH
ncbi:MAG: hypothetical protein NUW14_10850 [Deltaproteobacteria bacterium]|nr:hypothetical protein [Deltaproteobacteria bacterium]